MSLLGNILEPNPQGGLLDLAMNLAQAGGAGKPTMAGLAGAVQQTRRDMVAAREYERERRMAALQDKALEDMTDADLREAYLLGGPSGYAAIVAAKARQQYGYGDVPMSVKEWQFYKTLSPEDQRQFLINKRQQQVLDLGGSYGFADPTRPGIGGVEAGPEKTLAPGERPETRGEQAEQTELGKGRGTRFNEDYGKVVTSKGSLGLINDARRIIDNESPTGSWVGSAADTMGEVIGVSVKGAAPAAALKIIGGELISKVPRMEGPQSDRDTQLYKDMAGQIGNDKIPLATRRRALQQLEELASRYTTRGPNGEWVDLSGGGALVPSASGQAGTGAPAMYDNPEKEARYQQWKRERGLR